MGIPDEAKGYTLVFLAVFIWSFGEILIKILQNTVGAYAYAFLRLIIGGLFLFLILGIKNDFSGIKQIIKKNWPLLLFASFFGLGISNTLFFIGISLTYANVGALIFTTYPIWTTLYSIIFLNERSNIKLKFIGIGIGIFGITILLLSFQPNSTFNIQDLFKHYSHLLGNIIALAASMIWSIYSVSGKKIQLNSDEVEDCDLKFSSISLSLSAIPIFIILVFEAYTIPGFELLFNYSQLEGILYYDLVTWFWIIVLGVVSTGIAYYSFFSGVKYIEVSKGISLALLKPIIATIFAFLILGEPITFILVIERKVRYSCQVFK